MTLADRVAAIPLHTIDPPEESTSPRRHYRRAANDAWNTLRYFENSIPTNAYAAVADRHVARMRAMVLISLVEALERFLKEAAALCVDQLASLTLDDRLKEFTAHPRSVAAHFTGGSLGAALCEGDTWLDVTDVNKRFRLLLADPFVPGNFYLFEHQPNQNDYWRTTTTSVLFQLRHSVVHNVMLITRSDAAKLRLLTKVDIPSPRVLAPIPADVHNTKRFLDELVEWLNGRLATRLTALLTTIHTGDPTLFVAQDRANALATRFGLPVTVAGATANP